MTLCTELIGLYCILLYSCFVSCLASAVLADLYLEKLVNFSAFLNAGCVGCSIERHSGIFSNLPGNGWRIRAWTMIPRPILRWVRASIYRFMPILHDRFKGSLQASSRYIKMLKKKNKKVGKAEKQKSGEVRKAEKERSREAEKQSREAEKQSWEEAEKQRSKKSRKGEKQRSRKAEKQRSREAGKRGSRKEHILKVPTY